MKNILKIMLMIVCITSLFSSVVTSAVSKETLQELITNKKIEEVVKRENTYELKVKLSEEFKEIVVISMDDTESIDLLSNTYNINSLLINGNKNAIVSTIEPPKEEVNTSANEKPVEEQVDNNEILKQDIKASLLVPLSERIDKYKVDNTISLEDLLLEISENKIKNNKIYKYKIEKENEDDIQKYRYEVTHSDIDSDLVINGDIETINLPLTTTIMDMSCSIDFFGFLIVVSLLLFLLICMFY